MTTLLSRYARNARSAAEYLSAYAHEFERAAALYRASGQEENAEFNETMAREFHPLRSDRAAEREHGSPAMTLAQMFRRLFADPPLPECVRHIEIAHPEYLHHSTERATEPRVIDWRAMQERSR